MNAQRASVPSQRLHTQYRTSKNSWLTGKFTTDPIVTTVDARIANLTGLFAGNSEHYQYAACVGFIALSIVYTP
jgi:hypothetical protein